MARHRSYSKRSRESRKAMGDGVGDEPDYPNVDHSTLVDRRAQSGDRDPPPDRKG